jgi:hypothetical protein
MKTNRVLAILFTVVFAIACDDQPEQDLNVIIANIEITGEKPNLKKIIKAPQNEVFSDEYAVTQILTTSPRFRQLTKGLYSKTSIETEGLSYGIILAGSPNKKQNTTRSFSRNYDFTVYQLSPDGKLNTGYFSFDPKNKQLYEYDATKNQLNAIEFDRNLLVKYEILLSTGEDLVVN